MPYDHDPKPQPTVYDCIAEDHELIPAAIQQGYGCDAFKQVNLDRYRVLLRDMNRHVERVREFQLKMLALGGDKDIDEAIKSLLP